ncbi:MAG: aspartyl protease family protein [Phycisphaerales bacterium]|nr:aspartyl protease family protein [Phycisphaerales bacterium]
MRSPMLMSVLLAPFALTAVAAPIVIQCSPNGVLVADVTIGGKPLRFLVDTALPGDGRIDVEIAKELNLPSGGTFQTSEEGEGIPLVVGEKFSIGGIDFDKVYLWSVPLGAKQQPEASRIHGAIGWQLFKGRVYTVDFVNRKIIVDDAPPAEGPNTFPLDTSAFSPEVPAIIGGVKTTATLNSGNNMGMVVPNSMAATLALTKEPWPAGKIGTGATILRARTKEPISLAGLTTNQTGIDFLAIWPTPNAGLVAMEPFAYTFDLVNKKIRVSKPEGTPAKPTRYGVAFDQQEKGIVVIRTFDGSVAATSGLLEGDIVKTINGSEVKTTQDVMAAMKSPKVSVAVERDGKPTTVEMALPQ